MLSQHGCTNAPKALKGGNQKTGYEIQSVSTPKNQSDLMNPQYSENEAWARQFAWPDDEVTTSDLIESRCSWCGTRIIDEIPHKFCSDECQQKPKLREVYSKFEVNFIFAQYTSVSDYIDQLLDIKVPTVLVHLIRSYLPAGCLVNHGKYQLCVSCDLPELQKLALNTYSLCCQSKCLNTIRSGDYCNTHTEVSDASDDEW